MLPFFLIGLIIVLPFWRIFSKAGFNGALSILMIIPLLNLFMIYFLAFSDWPALKTPPGGIYFRPPRRE
jgi:hypothetical protein